MTPTDYTNPERFPLTTQKGLSADQQLLIDAFNLDQLRERAEEAELTERQKSLLAELEAKEKVFSAVRAELKTAAK